MNTELIVGILAATGFGAIATALVTGLFSKRKLGAEATQIITDAAAGVVTELRAELNRKSAEMKTMVEEHYTDRARMKAEHETEMTEVRSYLRKHAEWDEAAIKELRRFGVELPAVPPLFP